MENKNKLFKFLFTIPVVVYSILLIFLPLMYIFVISFFKSDGYGGMIETFTFGNYMQKNKNYTPKRKMPTATKQWASPNLERREVEKRV